MSEPSAPDSSAAPPEPGGKGHWRPSIAVVLIFGFGVLILLAVGSVMLVILGTARDSTLELLGRQAETTVTSVVDQIDRIKDYALDGAEFVAQLIARGELDLTDSEHLEDVLMGALAGTPEVTAIGYVDPAYVSIFVGRGEDGQILRQKAALHDNPTLRNLVSGTRLTAQQSWFEIIWSEELIEPHITLAVPITRDGQEVGTIVSVISLKALSQVLARYDKAYGTNSFILRGRDRVLAHPLMADGFAGLSDDQPLPALDQFEDQVLRAIWQPVKYEIEAISEDSSIEGRLVDGPEQEHIFLYQRIDELGDEPIYVGVHWPEAEAGLELRRLLWAGVIALAILAVATILAVLLGRAMARPIRRLSEASVAIGSLNLRDVQPLDGSAFRELDRAAEAYNAMLRGLRWFESYVPRTLVLRLMSLGEGALVSEERQVTVLFTDMVGFTSISSRLSADQVAEILNQQFGLITEAIEAQGGTVDKFIGDGVMAYWGAPEDQPDQAARGCRAALAIAAAVARDCAGRDPALKLRIGLHTGPAVVGNIGAPGRVNYTLIGDTVNTAQRLEGLGKSFMTGQEPAGAVMILISGDTAAALEPGFNLEPVGPHRLVGRDQETEVFCLRP